MCSVSPHCRKLKPTWDKLGDEFADNPDIIIAEVDCTADGMYSLFGVNSLSLV